MFEHPPTSIGFLRAYFDLVGGFLNRITVDRTGPKGYHAFVIFYGVEAVSHHIFFRFTNNNLSLGMAHDAATSTPAGGFCMGGKNER